MKVYVDELPKSCIDCPCESEGFCNLIPLDYCYGTPPKDCPLQTIADHDKQVIKVAYKKLVDMLLIHQEMIRTGSVIEPMFTYYDLVECVKELEKGE